MTRTTAGDFVIKSRTLKQWAMIVGALAALGPTLGVGVTFIARDANRDASIRDLQRKYDDLSASMEKSLDKIDARLRSIDDYLRGNHR